MNSLKQLVSRNFYTIMYLLIAGSFLGLAAELVWTGHWEGIQRVGLVASGVGALLALVALIASAQLRTILAVLFLALSITGIVGAVEHNEERNEEATAPVIMAASVNANVVAQEESEADEDEDEEEEEGEHGEEGEEIPPLAPLSLAGMSVIGAVTLLADDRNRSDG